MLGVRWDTYGSLLKNPNYRRWFTSSLGSSLGDWIGLFALQVLIVSIADPGTRTALFGLGGLMTARLLPSVLLGPVSGVLADRLDRRLLMVGCDVGRAALFVGIAFTRNIVLLLVLVFVVESLSMLYLTTKMTVLPSIVEPSQLPEANQIGLGVAFAPLPLGAAAAAAMSWLAGVLNRLGVVHVQSTTVALLINAATFLLSGAILWRLHLSAAQQPRDEDSEKGTVERLREGLQVLRGRPELLALTLAAVGMFFGVGVILTLGPELVRSELGRPSEDWYGAVAAVGFGALTGFLAAPVVGRLLGRGRLLQIGLLVLAALVVAPAFMTGFRALQGVGFLLGGGAAIVGVSGFTMLQERTPEEVRGRTFALFFTATRVALFASLALAPFAAATFGVYSFAIGEQQVELSGIRLMILVGGIVALVTALVTAHGLRAARRRESR